MILRKPYAFLIKYFRLIHAVLALLMLFTIYKANTFYKFIIEYIRQSNYLKLYIEPSIHSVGILIFLIIILIISIFSSIIILMNKKKKPIGFYFISIIFYFAFLIFLILYNSQLYSLLLNRSSLKIMNIYRDFSNIFYLLQFPILFICALRAIGFNVKKFNFEQDLKELNISEEDREEFEVSLEVDTDNFKMRLRRSIRIFKYIIKENKKLLLFVLTALISILVVKITLNIFIYDKVYKQRENFRHGYLEFNVINSYVTQFDYSMETISDGKIYYVVLFDVKNNSNESQKINTNNIYLNLNKASLVQPNIKIYQKFIDLGVGYSSQVLAKNSTNRYILVYEADKNTTSSKIALHFLKSYTLKNGKLKYEYTKVKLNPIKLDNIANSSEAKLENTLEMKDNILGRITMNVSNFEISNIAEYQYKKVINKKEYTFTGLIQPTTSNYYDKKIMKLQMNIEFDSTINKNAIDRFLGKYCSIRYYKGERKFVSAFRGKDLTPDSIKDYKYIEVPAEINDADRIYMDIIIRNMKYSYQLK